MTSIDIDIFLKKEKTGAIKSITPTICLLKVPPSLFLFVYLELRIGQLRQQRLCRSPVVLHRLVRTRKLYGNAKKYGQNERRVRTKGSIRVRARI